MLERLHRLAVYLRPLRTALLLCIVVFFSLAAAGLFYLNQNAESLVLPGLAGALWCGLAYACIELFQTLPPPPSPRHGFVKRFVLWMKRVLLSILAFAIILLTLMLIWLSLRVLSV